MNELLQHDLHWALVRCPKSLTRVMQRPEWTSKIFVGGGFLRSIVAGDPVNDVDVFVPSKEHADKLARDLVGHHLSITDEVEIEKRIHRTDNALTILCLKPMVQIIHRWVFDTAEDVAKSFDFTCCCAAFLWAGSGWKSYCDERFYPDVASKRLVYRSPIRNEDAGGSMLRVLKYYQKGYRIPLDSLAAVVGRLMKSYNLDFNELSTGSIDEERCKFVITGLLREVDPLIDPTHAAHLPAEGAPALAEG